MTAIHEPTKEQESDYIKYRGKCKEFCEEETRKDPSLLLVRGWYWCPFWGQQQHWWCKKPDGTVFDPTKNQFPSKGIGEYIEYNGVITCEECGKTMPEHEAYFVEHHVFCSYICYGHCIEF